MTHPDLTPATDVVILGSLSSSAPLVYHRRGTFTGTAVIPAPPTGERARIAERAGATLWRGWAWRTGCGRVAGSGSWAQVDESSLSAVEGTYWTSDRAAMIRFDRARLIARPCRRCWPD